MLCIVGYLPYPELEPSSESDGFDVSSSPEPDEANIKNGNIVIKFKSDKLDLANLKI